MFVQNTVNIKYINAGYRNFIGATQNHINFLSLDVVYESIIFLMHIYVKIINLINLIF